MLDPEVFVTWFRAVAERFGKRFSDESIEAMYDVFQDVFGGDTAGFVAASKSVLCECNEYPSVNEWQAKKPVAALPGNHASHVMPDRQTVPAAPPPEEVKQRLDELFRSLRAKKAAGAMSGVGRSQPSVPPTAVTDADIERFKRAQLALLSGDHHRADAASQWLLENPELVASIRQAIALVEQPSGEVAHEA